MSARSPLSSFPAKKTPRKLPRPLNSSTIVESSPVRHLHPLTHSRVISSDGCAPGSSCRRRGHGRRGHRCSIVAVFVTLAHFRLLGGGRSNCPASECGVSGHARPQCASRRHDRCRDSPISSSPTTRLHSSPEHSSVRVFVACAAMTSSPVQSSCAESTLDGASCRQGCAVCWTWKECSSST